MSAFPRSYCHECRMFQIFIFDSRWIVIKNFSSQDLSLWVWQRKLKWSYPCSYPHLISSRKSNDDIRSPLYQSLRRDLDRQPSTIGRADRVTLNGRYIHEYVEGSSQSYSLSGDAASVKCCTAQSHAHFNEWRPRDVLGVHLSEIIFISNIYLLNQIGNRSTGQDENNCTSLSIQTLHLERVTLGCCDL